ncbi:MAG: hypothetical protein ABI192_00385 [Bradyrhizobium sp.]
MQSFLYEVVARIVAAYLCFDCYQRISNGLAERKIKCWNDNFLNWTVRFADRDATPVQYWIQIGFQAIALVSCLVIAICGWFHPTA